jgi:hypothetical protein
MRERASSQTLGTDSLELTSGAFMHSQVIITYGTPLQHRDISRILCLARTGKTYLSLLEPMGSIADTLLYQLQHISRTLSSMHVPLLVPVLTCIDVVGVLHF